MLRAVRWLSLLLGLAVCGSGALARATLVVPLDLPRLAEAAECIELGRVERQAARRTPDGRMIVTQVTIRIEQPLKGKLRAGERVEVFREGGEIGSVGARVEGAARFSEGEEVLVFLERRGTSAWWTVGMAQGKMRVETIGGRRVAIRDLGGLTFVGPTGGKAPAAGGAVMPLDEVLQIIARATRGAPAGP